MYGVLLLQFREETDRKMYISTEAGLIHQVKPQVPSTLGTQQQKDQAGHRELKCVWHIHSPFALKQQKCRHSHLQKLLVIMFQVPVTSSQLSHSRYCGLSAYSDIQCQVGVSPGLLQWSAGWRAVIWKWKDSPYFSPLGAYAFVLIPLYVDKTY